MLAEVGRRELFRGGHLRREPSVTIRNAGTPWRRCGRAADAEEQLTLSKLAARKEDGSAKTAKRRPGRIGPPVMMGLGIAILSAIVVASAADPRGTSTPDRPAAAAVAVADANGEPGQGLTAAAQVPRRPRTTFGGLRAIDGPRSGHSPFALPLMPIDGPLDLRPPLQRDGGAPFEFYFTRAAYSGFGLQGFASWSVDFPKADQQFMIGVRRLLGHLDAYTHENPILLTDPELLKYPFLYVVEPGHMSLTDEEVLGLRRYLEAGGFVMLDDFWGSLEWANVELELERVMPDHPVVELDPEHPVFHCFYDVEEVVQVPNVGLGRAGGRTFEQDGYFPEVRGLIDDDGRLMVAIHWNSDLGDAWEWAEDAYYPLEFSTYAYQMGVNYIVYAMTH